MAATSDDVYVAGLRALAGEAAVEDCDYGGDALKINLRLDYTINTNADTCGRCEHRVRDYFRGGSSGYFGHCGLFGKDVKATRNGGYVRLPQCRAAEVKS